MAGPTLEELSRHAEEAVEPQIVPASEVAVGGVDPLGLRQINFDLMDQCLPGINNVGRHIRPYVVVAWAWRRAAQCARKDGRDRITLNELRDFVDRIEVIYAWSQFYRDPNADLPGRDVLASLRKADSYRFGGAEWRKRREDRRYSTAFSAPITYGPALRSLGWLVLDEGGTGAMAPPMSVYEALDAFEAEIGDFLGHDAFSKFGEVEVLATDVALWADAWALERPTEPEQRAMARALKGDGAAPARRQCVTLLLNATAHVGDDLSSVRRAMAGAPQNLPQASEQREAIQAWRAMQVRQAFRLSLEGLLFWMTLILDGGPHTTDRLIARFEAATPERTEISAWEWLTKAAHESPIDVIGALEAAMAEGNADALAPVIADAIAYCINEASETGQAFERYDRLPLFRAKREAFARGEESASDLLRHIFESWVLAQHVYWSIGRGLADARARGKTLLRLRIVLEEAGWSLAPGIRAGGAPVPTPDRLRTALSLVQESGLLN